MDPKTGWQSTKLCTNCPDPVPQALSQTLKDNITLSELDLKVCCVGSNGMQATVLQYCLLRKVWKVILQHLAAELLVSGELKVL